MTADIHHTSRKPMATGSALGRLLTISFLCFLFNMIAFAQDTSAAQLTITFANGGSSGNSVQVKLWPSGSIIDVPLFDTDTVDVTVGDEIYLEGVAATGWQFDSWGGYISGSGNISGNFTMPSSDVSIEATFVPIYKITATAGTGGSINPSGDVTPVTILSSPQVFAVSADPGYRIDEVLVNGAAAVPVVPDGAISYSYTFATGSITSDQTIAANFVRNPRSLTLAVNDSSVGGADAGSGSISGKPGGSALGTFSYVYGDEVTLTATATLPGWKFDSWSGSGAVYVAAADSASTTLTMPDADIELTANFVRNPRSLTLAVNDSSVGGADAGSGSISGKPGGSALRHFLLRVRGRGYADGHGHLTRLEV